MGRVFGLFQFIGCREVDKPENNPYRVITKSEDPQDWLKAQKADDARTQADLDTMQPVPELVAWDDIDVQGAWTAAHAGPEQLQRWRDDNIGKTPTGVTEEGVSA